MASNDLFAPPSPDELKMSQGTLRQNNDLFAPPTPDEVKAAAPEQPGLLKRGLDYGLRALDYPGGFMRAGLANAAGLVSGQGSVVKPEDLSAAAVGQGPNSAEYLKRLGVTEGPSAELPFLGHTSLRDAEGLGLDIATDPLTAISKGVKALRPVGEAAEVGGKSIYKSGLKKVDEKLAEKGAKPISDLLLEEGKTGTTKTLAKDAEEIGRGAKDERAALYDKAAKAGLKVDMSKILEKSSEAVAKMKEDPGLAPAAEKLEELIERYKKAGEVDLATASEWKSNLYNALPESAYDAHGKVKGPAAKVQKALASDFKNGIVDAGNKVEKGLGDSIDALNETMQTTITAKKPMAMQVRRAGTPNFFSAVDGIIAGYGTHDPVTAAGILAAKKAADASKTTYVRTKLGKGLIDAGRSGTLDAVARRGLINQGNSKKPGLLVPQDGLLKVSGEGE